MEGRSWLPSDTGPGLCVQSLPVWAIRQVERSAWLCPLLSLHRLQIRWRSSASDSGPLSTSPHGPGRRVSTHLCVSLQKTVRGLPARCSGGVPAGVGAGCVTGPLAELSALWAVSRGAGRLLLVRGCTVVGGIPTSGSDGSCACGVPTALGDCHSPRRKPTPAPGPGCGL